jgi:hypothetical protein
MPLRSRAVGTAGSIAAIVAAAVGTVALILQVRWHRPRVTITWSGPRGQECFVAFELFLKNTGPGIVYDVRAEPLLDGRPITGAQTAGPTTLAPDEPGLMAVAFPRPDVADVSASGPLETHGHRLAVRVSRKARPLGRRRSLDLAVQEKGMLR